MYIPEARGIASFHGESWHLCPHCNYTFEFYAAVYGFEKGEEERTFICPECKKLFRIK